MNIVLTTIQVLLTLALGVICIKLAHDLEYARYIGAGLLRYMEDHGLELPPPEEMRRIIDSYWEEDA